MAYDRHLLYHSLRISADHRWASAYRRRRPFGRIVRENSNEGREDQVDDEARVIPIFGDHEHSSHG